jgi:O-glycosyl hydrolase
MQAAKDRGVEKFLAFTISPPVFYTKNGKAFAPADVNMNIQDGKMADYANYLVEVCDHFQQEGTPISNLSPVNETQWNWTGSGQEGTPATNAEVAELVRHISAGLDQKGLNTQIVVSEAGALTYLYAGDKPDRDYQVDAFFSPGSANFIADLPNVANIISGHSYWTTYPNQKLIDTRLQLSAKLDATPNGPGFWQTEFSVMENTDVGGGWDRDLTINTALYVARVIHHDLTLANARSWQWWTALSQYDYKDGLIFLDNGNDGIRSAGDPDAETLKSDGFYRESKLLWALGNFSRFIRPGMVRVEAGFKHANTANDQVEKLMVSAFKDKQEKDLVLVFVNYSKKEQKVSVNQLGSGFHLASPVADAYVTSENANLQKSTMNATNALIPPRSVVTLCFQLE